jgi:L-methionine (R)-S-oxide reductase
VDLDEAVIGRTVASLHDQGPAFDWVGVYLVDGDTLVLGPFRGLPTEHERIPLGQGVCGSVAETGRTEVVPDVRRRPGHIACDINTRSEVVAPIVREGEVIGVLDVDSNTLDAFGRPEVELIEDAAGEIAANA